jgi:cell wall-associated NlpC family hydrolase
MATSSRSRLHTPPLTRVLRGVGLVLASMVMCLSVAQASPKEPSPQEPSDRITRFLQERGLTASETGQPGLFGQVRDQVRDHATDLVMNAMNFLGVSYRRGGNSADTGFDCSGFTRHVFENSLGMLLPRRSQDQAQLPGLLSIRAEDMKPGDLVFFNTMRHAFSHVGIYLGEGKFIHAPRTGSQVRVEDMRQSYWVSRFNGARRAPVLADAAALPGMAASAAENNLPR